MSVAASHRSPLAGMRGVSKHSRLFWYVLGTLLVIAIGARMSLPVWLLHQVNARLSHVPGYEGHVADIGVSLYRGAYQLNDVRIMKKAKELKEPFFAAKTIDFSLAWRELFRGKFVSDISIEEGQLNLVKGPTEETSQLEADKRWQSVINDLFPIEITHFEIRKGLLRYIETDSKPRIDLSVRHLDVVATGLRNRPSEEHEEYPAKLSIRGTTIGEGELNVFAEGDPLADQPHFNLKVQLNKVSLPALNEFLQAYGSVDVSRGKFEAYVEVGAKGGRYEGYVKPFFSDLQFTSVEDKDKNIAARLWEKIVAGVAAILKNRAHEQVATRIPFSGDFENTKFGVWSTIRNLFYNGFVRALSEGLEGSVKADDVKGSKDSDKKSRAKSEQKTEPRPTTPNGPPR